MKQDDMGNEIKFKCCVCRQEFISIEDANNHRIPSAADGFKQHAVVPISVCTLCKGCD